ncbi:dienelactone hydrolase family protein [Streptomyces sp. DSM 44917]|uniref:Dienelactone hydrolase family protein n=1 Tax=Streptomyces boetiae TaxID=3075541 RepID=A0ABU2LAB6_9ACTN|nr:dienelactone hydrolase family protein [Streptomyces sp. DSM 44917]MDT0308442.1 dienelactone hydrolase family protein [Streptomyces sp. DSM 44917]
MAHGNRKTRRAAVALPLVAALAPGGILLNAGGAAVATEERAPGAAAEHQFRRGPDPTAESVANADGPFEVERVTVPRGNGFGGGTIHYPADSSQGDFGGIAISPGFMSPQFLMGWYGPMFASHGFVTIVIDTSTVADPPDSRADQLQAALDYLTTQSEVRDRVDPDRLAVAGHSMGGGGALRAAANNPDLQAAIPLEPWHLTNAWQEVTVPTMIVGGQFDFVAPVAFHAESFYENLTAAPERAYLELAGGSHFDVFFPNRILTRYMVSWAKRYVDNDTRYEQFLCPAPAPGNGISEYRESCPTG